MNEIYGVVEAVNQNNGTSKETGKPYLRWEFKVSGKKYSTFDSAIGTSFKVGDHVKIIGEQGEKYFNMKAMEIADVVTVEKISANVASASRDFHLSIEECRARALECALKTPEFNWSLVVCYFDWIYKGECS